MVGRASWMARRQHEAHLRSVPLRPKERVVTEYADRIRRRVRIARLGRGLFLLFALAGLVGGAVRGCRALRARADDVHVAPRS
ncbi:hypothetical protein DB32_005364 [Sandaracinus amylolyticus]|uniref:Uncharacterized protein n=1 Tax=Sandaracinus amylolyticus TaxID=927083 RepID=A0A0F6W629_9BACT|nr:hypothetical protein DB32_005364 [Sandaracinus amylolyticus]